MNKRRVRQVSPTPEEGIIVRAFSAYLDRPNVVLLGDPGSGKSYLFEKAAALAGGPCLTVRDFLNIPTSCLSATLFIDALDERRAGRGDSNAIDSVVRKLFESSPRQVRISCRVQDWLGDTDLAAFRPYFDRHGGAVVLALEPLSREEMTSVLSDRGVRDPAAFLERAYELELDDLLVNPQNLIMLADVVSRGSWPKKRRDLYDAATEFLLHEHSPNRSRTGEGVYGVAELREAAGAICAIRLIADVEGISLRENNDCTDYPTYRTIDPSGVERIRAALGRRIFRAGHKEETVDYSHRMIAEYMAAAWLAVKVRKGFPLGRVRALIGVDGSPASELRGVHAWLPVFLPECANVLIDADPFGVLAYGDAASLEPSGRRRVLEALARLAASDPWFRAGSWSTRGLGALAGPDMVVPFREILGLEPRNFMLRSVVLDSLANGAPISELKPDLTTILKDARSSYAERIAALVALLKFGEASKTEIRKQYYDLGDSGNELRLRAEILTALYDEFGPKDVGKLMLDGLECPEQLPVGTLWRLPETIPAPGVLQVLDELTSISLLSNLKTNWRNVSEFSHTLDRLLLRALRETSGPIAAFKLKAWLSFRLAMERFEPIRLTEGIKSALSKRLEELRLMFREMLGAMAVNERGIRRFYEFDRLTLGAADPDDLLDWSCEFLRDEQLDTIKEDFIYQVALWSTFRGTARGRQRFEWLWQFADERTNLAVVRDNNLSVPIPDWRREERERIARRASEREASRVKNRQDFEQHRAQIRSGINLGWLDWLARIYFGMFTDVEHETSPRQRLIGELGEANAQIAIEGFRALLRRDDFPNLDAQLRLRAENKHYTMSYPLLAGLEEEWGSGATPDSLSDELLGSALAMDLFCLTPTYSDDELKNKRPWKTWLFRHRPQLVNEVYLEIARSELARGLHHVEGLQVLLADEALTPFLGAASVQLLTMFPNAAAPPLRSLLRAVLDCPDVVSEFLTIADEVLSNGYEIDLDQADAWLAAAYLVSPSKYGLRLAAVAKHRIEIVWQIRDFAEYRRFATAGRPLALSPDQMAEIARMCAQHSSNSYPPLGSSSGDRNPWDMAGFARSLIDQIASQPTKQATDLLTGLLALSDLNSYGDHIKHALATQRATRRDAEYKQPDWRQTIGALFRGLPANVSDLHALLIDELRDIKLQIGSSNTDIYKRFWNEDHYGRVDTPKPEESGRDVLVELMRERFRPLGVIVEPEGHMVADKRADISVALPGQKIVVELKRDYHPEVWSAADSQLDRFYTRDYEASGFGIYGVFWFGPHRGQLIPAPPAPLRRPASAEQMENQLRARLPDETRARIEIVVIDVGGPPPG